MQFRRLAVITALTSCVLSTASLAASGSTACFIGPARLSDGDISAFTAQPAALLDTSPKAGLALSSRVRALSGTSASTLDALIALVGKSDDAQKSAIGAGLGRAARACQAGTPDYALLIQQKVAALNDTVVSQAFRAALDDIQTASLGGGSVSGIAGGGSVSGASGGSRAESSTQTSTPSATESFSVGSRAAFVRGSRDSQDVSPSQ